MLNVMTLSRAGSLLHGAVGGQSITPDPTENPQPLEGQKHLRFASCPVGR
jgi:hypothetical protein